MKNGKLDRINLLKYLMVVLLIIYVVFLVTREGDNTVSVDTIEKNITKAVKLEGMKKGTTQDLKMCIRDSTGTDPDRRTGAGRIQSRT